VLAFHIPEQRALPPYKAYSSQIAAFRESLERLLAELLEDGNEDAQERVEQALAALYRLEWSLRRDGHSEIALPVRANGSGE